MTTGDYSYLGIGSAPSIPPRFPVDMPYVRAMAYSNLGRAVMIQMYVPSAMVEDAPALRDYCLDYLGRFAAERGETIDEETLRASWSNGIDATEEIDLGTAES
jgi:hypothetical protein